MRAVAVLFVTSWFTTIAVVGQGFFEFNNRFTSYGINARFVLNTDPPGTSSVGTNFQAQLFAAPAGTPVDELLPTDPPSTGFRGPAGSVVAGYVRQIEAIVSGATAGDDATVLVRVFDGPNWATATYRYEGIYNVIVIDGLPPPFFLPLGNSPLVLYPVPEPPTLALCGLSLFGWLLYACRPCGGQPPNEIGAGKGASALSFQVVQHGRALPDLWR
jgi:hypothetical protein